MHAQSCHFHEVRGQAVAVDRGADSGQRSVASRLQGDSTDVTRRVSQSFSVTGLGSSKWHSR